MEPLHAKSPPGRVLSDCMYAHGNPTASSALHYPHSNSTMPFTTPQFGQHTGQPIPSNVSSYGQYMNVSSQMPSYGHSAPSSYNSMISPQMPSYGLSASSHYNSLNEPANVNWPAYGQHDESLQQVFPHAGFYAPNFNHSHGQTQQPFFSLREEMEEVGEDWNLYVCNVKFYHCGHCSAYFNSHTELLQHESYECYKNTAAARFLLGAENSPSVGTHSQFHGAQCQQFIPSSADDVAHVSFVPDTNNDMLDSTRSGSDDIKADDDDDAESHGNDFFPSSAEKQEKNDVNALNMAYTVKRERNVPQPDRSFITEPASSTYISERSVPTAVETDHPTPLTVGNFPHKYSSQNMQSSFGPLATSVFSPMHRFSRDPQTHHFVQDRGSGFHMNRPTKVMKKDLQLDMNKGARGALTTENGVQLLFTPPAGACSVSEISSQPMAVLNSFPNTSYDTVPNASETHCISSVKLADNQTDDRKGQSFLDLINTLSKPVNDRYYSQTGGAADNVDDERLSIFPPHNTALAPHTQNKAVSVSTFRFEDELEQPFEGKGKRSLKTKVGDEKKDVKSTADPSEKTPRRRKLSEVYKVAEGRYACDECPKLFGAGYLILRHKKRHRDATGFRFFCDVCSKGFKFPHHLREHRNIHTGAKPFVCNTCGQRFTHSGSYWRHFNKQHSDKKRYACSDCDKYFSHQTTLMCHVSLNRCPAKKKRPCDVPVGNVPVVRTPSDGTLAQTVSTPV